MFRRCTAAAADYVRTEVFCKVLDLRRKALRRLVVVLLTVLHFRQPRVWQNRYGQRRVLAKIPKTVGHLLWPGSAVHSDDVDRKRFERGQRRADLGAVQHRPERLDCHLSDDGDLYFLLFEMFKDRRECG